MSKKQPWDLGYLRWSQLPEEWRDVVDAVPPIDVRRFRGTRDFDVVVGDDDDLAHAPGGPRSTGPCANASAKPLGMLWGQAFWPAAALLRGVRGFRPTPRRLESR